MYFMWSFYQKNSYSIPLLSRPVLSNDFRHAVIMYYISGPTDFDLCCWSPYSKLTSSNPIAKFA